jgi:hypothetical protein
MERKFREAVANLAAAKLARLVPLQTPAILQRSGRWVLAALDTLSRRLRHSGCFSFLAKTQPATPDRGR